MNAVLYQLHAVVNLFELAVVVSLLLMLTHHAAAAAAARASPITSSFRLPSGSVDGATLSAGHFLDALLSLVIVRRRSVLDHDDVYEENV